MIVISDLQYAIRLLAKKPGFTALTTLVMATGIGLSVYLFSFLNTMAFKALPFKDGESLVVLSSSQNGARNFGEINLHDYYEIRTSLKGLSEFGAYHGASVNVSGRDGARRYNAIAAEPNIFRITRTKPILGREFTDAENRKGAEEVVVIGYDLWQTRFGGDAEVIDQILRINGVSHRIIGVMPQGYYFPDVADMWMPIRKDATQLARGSADSVYGIAHLETGVSMQYINRQLAIIMQRIEEKYPKTNTGISAYVDTLPMQVVEDAIAVVYSMHIVAVLILVLASVNVGNLLLSRAIERGKETAIRMALGAPRSRLIGQMLWESIIICSVGGVIGLLVMAWGLEVTERVTGNFSFGKQVFWFKFGVDSFTLYLFFSFVFCTILVTGLLPAWRNSGADFNAVLRDGTRGALGKKAGRLNTVLVVSEIFLSVAVLIAAGVMILSSYIEINQDNGADTENVLTAELLLTESEYDTGEKQVEFVEAFQSRLESSAGIEDVMISTALPGVYTSTPAVALEGREYTEERGYLRVNYIIVTAGSLAKLGVELKEGRYFSSVDDGLDKGSVIVTDSFASRHFPNQSSLGKRLRIVELDGDVPNWITIVGVVEHTIQGSATGENGRLPSVFRPFTQSPRSQMTVAMRMKSDTASVVRTLRRTLASIDPELPAYRIESYAEKMTRLSGPSRFISKVFLLFGVAAVVLAASGIYGVMSNTVNQRTQEIGVKRALGAWDQRIIGEFLMMGCRHLLWGGVPGLVAGCALGFAMSNVLGTGSTALLIIAVTMVSIIGSVLMFATYLPTTRALEMEPSQALHYE